MSTVDRRTFLQTTGLAASGAALLGGPMQALVARAARAAGGPPPHAGGAGAGYGPLSPTPEEDTGELLMALPEGFHYRVIGAAGTPMSDGEPTPRNHDGMASFPASRGRIRMVRNHEVLPLDAADQHAFGTDARTPYDPEGPGGTTTLELTPHGRITDSWVSLNGTTMNCAGGPMPWGAWISCEENVNGPDANVNFLGQTLDLTEPHGYIWEVPVGRGPGEVGSNEPIRSAGRFNHEAVAWGRDGRLYLTEDNFDGPSGFYRYTPPSDPFSAGGLQDGGTLEILRVLPTDAVPFSDTGAADLRGTIGVGTTLETAWVEIPDPDPTIPTGTGNTEASRAVVLQGYEQGAANFSRIEGCWFGEGQVFFNATTGGAFDGDPTAEPLRSGDGLGQIWSYDVASGQLVLLVEASEDGDVPTGPDNLTFTPQGALLVCEDFDETNYLRGVTRDGEVFDFALNITEGFEDSEWAGVNFSPNDNVLFANLQDIRTADMPDDLPGPEDVLGVTVAIWGPFRRGPL